MKRYRPTRHFVERALEMSVAPDEIELALTKPHRISPSHAQPDCHIYSRGDVAIVVNKNMSPPALITILWTNEQAWRKDVKRGGPQRKSFRPPDRKHHE